MSTISHFFKNILRPAGLVHSSPPNGEVISLTRKTMSASHFLIGFGGVETDAFLRGVVGRESSHFSFGAATAGSLNLLASKHVDGEGATVSG